MISIVLAEFDLHQGDSHFEKPDEIICLAHCDRPRCGEIMQEVADIRDVCLSHLFILPGFSFASFSSSSSSTVPYRSLYMLMITSEKVIFPRFMDTSASYTASVTETVFATKIDFVLNVITKFTIF